MHSCIRVIGADSRTGTITRPTYSHPFDAGRKRCRQPHRSRRRSARSSSRPAGSSSRSVSSNFLCAAGRACRFQPGSVGSGSGELFRRIHSGGVFRQIDHRTVRPYPGLRGIRRNRGCCDRRHDSDRSAALLDHPARDYRVRLRRIVRHDGKLAECQSRRRRTRQRVLDLHGGMFHGARARSASDWLGPAGGRCALQPRDRPVCHCAGSGHHDARRGTANRCGRLPSGRCCRAKRRWRLRERC